MSKSNPFDQTRFNTAVTERIQKELDRMADIHRESGESLSVLATGSLLAAVELAKKLHSAKEIADGLRLIANDIEHNSLH